MTKREYFNARRVEKRIRDRGIVSGYRTGISISELSRTFSMSITGITYVLKNNDVKILSIRREKRLQTLIEGQVVIASMKRGEHPSLVNLRPAVRKLLLKLGYIPRRRYRATHCAKCNVELKLSWGGSLTCNRCKQTGLRNEYQRQYYIKNKDKWVAKSIARALRNSNEKEAKDNKPGTSTVFP